MISVCIATYNGQKYILEQILSILPQIDLSDEVIISDDNSTDNTVSIIENINDKRIRIYNNNFRSPIKNFEFLIDICQGDIIFLSDQDDIWDNQKVKSHLLEYNKNLSIGLVISNIDLIDKNGNSIKNKFYKKIFTSNLYKNIITNNYIGCSISFRSNLKKYILPFPKNLPMHDWWIGIISSMFSNVSFLNDKLVYYRIHEDSFTNKNKNSFFKKFSFRIIILFHILLRLFKNKVY
jgi:glycosyltransferase involved in cell wall biosynthesis